ncbi:hypothetical protein [Halobaculum saliterrae]|uniref:hypothetical protein n=1 Tax=Halobaculum saliterrae TaxID=2073113 RepID=UPI0019167900|nr:hypothetical protein [Halobaculum saliterrae]
MCHFGPHRVEDEYGFLEEPDEPDEEVEAETAFEDEFEEAEDVRIVTDGGDD